jgi:Tfp pilus assembly protein PilO
MTLLNCIMVGFFIFGAGWFAYMSSHLVSEKKAGRQLPLPWESLEREGQKFREALRKDDHYE